MRAGSVHSLGRFEEQRAAGALAGRGGRHGNDLHGWRGDTDSQEKIQRRVECDLYYIENWSILLDLCILAQTPFALIRTENAY